MLEMFATTVQAELNATLHVCESGLQDIRILFGLVPKESLCIKVTPTCCGHDLWLSSGMKCCIDVRIFTVEIQGDSFGTRPKKM
jgi:hypothetical protein